MEPKADLFISEFWPMGFRQFEENELIPFMEYMKDNNPEMKSCALMRDYVRLNHADNSPASRVKVLNRYFDLAMFRGDNRLMPLKETLKGAEKGILIPIKHTGYMASLDSVQKEKNGPAVVVSAGGGDYPETDSFFKQAIKAREHSSRFSQLPWRLYVSRKFSENYMQELKELARQQPDGESIDIRYTDDGFLAALKGAQIALMRGGGSAVEAAAMHVSTVIFPFGNESSEQVIRANALAKNFPYVSVISSEEIKNEMHFARCVDDTYKASASLSSRTIKFDGARNAARNIIEFYNNLRMTEQSGKML